MINTAVRKPIWKMFDMFDYFKSQAPKIGIRGCWVGNVQDDNTSPYPYYPYLKKIVAQNLPGKFNSEVCFVEFSFENVKRCTNVIL